MDDPCFYGFPTYGEAGPKAAQDCGGQPVDPDGRSFDRDEAAFDRVEAFMAAHLPGALGPPILTRTCLYTLTPDRDFVVDRVPEAPGVTVLLGAAHGFKFASVLGRIAAELAVDGTTPSAAGPRAFPDRPADPARGGSGDELDGLTRSRRTQWATVCADARPVPRYRPLGQGGAPEGGDFRCDCPCAAEPPECLRRSA